jgi:hypothetical protein
MSDKDFKISCAKFITDFARGKAQSGQETRISKVGHYNRECFNPIHFINMSIGEGFRFLMNIYMEPIDVAGLEKVIQNLLTYIGDVADNYGDMINAEHSHGHKKLK